MTNRFGTDILIQAKDPRTAARFYVEHLGFEITDNNPKMIGLHGKHINLFIEPGSAFGTSVGGNGRQRRESQGATEERLRDR